MSERELSTLFENDPEAEDIEASGSSDTPGLINKYLVGMCVVICFPIYSYLRSCSYKTHFYCSNT